MVPPRCSQIALPWRDSRNVCFTTRRKVFNRRAQHGCVRQGGVVNLPALVSVGFWYRGRTTLQSKVAMRRLNNLFALSSPFPATRDTEFDRPIVFVAPVLSKDGSESARFLKRPSVNFKAPPNKNERFFIKWLHCFRATSYRRVVMRKRGFAL